MEMHIVFALEPERPMTEASYCHNEADYVLNAYLGVVNDKFHGLSNMLAYYENNVIDKKSSIMFETMLRGLVQSNINYALAKEYSSGVNKIICDVRKASALCYNQETRATMNKSIKKSISTAKKTINLLDVIERNIKNYSDLKMMEAEKETIPTLFEFMEKPAE